MMTSPSTAMTLCLPAPPLLQIRCTVSSTSIVKTTIHFSHIYPSCREEICCQHIELEQWRRDELRCYDPAPIFHFPPPPQVFPTMPSPPISPSLSHYAIPTNHSASTCTTNTSSMLVPCQHSLATLTTAYGYMSTQSTSPHPCSCHTPVRCP